MLKEGEKKAIKLGFTDSINFVQGDALKLPFPDSSFDAYTIAFAMRNVVDVNKVSIFSS